MTNKTEEIMSGKDFSPSQMRRAYLNLTNEYFQAWAITPQSERDRFTESAKGNRPEACIHRRFSALEQAYFSVVPDTAKERRLFNGQRDVVLSFLRRENAPALKDVTPANRLPL